MKPKPERITRQEFQCPCCQEWFAVGVARLPKPAQVVEANRDKVKALFSEPVPRKDVEGAGEIVAGNNAQRFITKCEQTSIDELFRKDKPKRNAWK